MNFKRKKLDYELTQDEINAFRSINVRMENIEKTINSADKNAPEAFWSAAFKHKDELTVELREWWTSIQTKYKSPDAARMDPNAGCLFVLLDENGNEDAETSLDNIFNIPWVE